MTTGRYQFLFDFEDRGNKPVFHDPTRRRKAKIRRFVFAVVCMLLAWTTLFFGDVISLPKMAEEIQLWWAANQLETDSRSDQGAEPGNDHDHDAMLIGPANAHTIAPDTCADSARPARAPTADGHRARLIGHLPGDVEWAPLSLDASCGVLDVVIVDWISIAPEGTGLRVRPAEPLARRAVEAHRDSGDKRQLVMSTVIFAEGHETGSLFSKLRDPSNTADLVAQLLGAAEFLDADGLCLDFRELESDQLQALGLVFEHFSLGLKQEGREACIVLASGQQIWTDPDLMRHFDQVILKAFNNPWAGSPPGPLAANAWFTDLAERALAAVGPERLTLALGNYAVKWTTRQPLPVTLPFAEALRELDSSGARPTLSPETGNSFGSFRDQNGNSHKLWLLDSASLFNQIRILRALGILNYGIWTLGYEDPGVWDVLAQHSLDPTVLASDLGALSFPNYIAYTGEGPFLRILERQKPGRRQVLFNPDTGFISAMAYTRMPRPYLIERYGRPPSNKLVLTFDDGPSAEYTGPILEVLKETQTPAAFFVVGAQVMEEPELLNRIIEEGHEIGSHTFSHPRMDQISGARKELELGMTAKLIAGYTGYETVLYREPFLRAGGPLEASLLPSLEMVQANGNVIAGIEIVPRDWEGMTAASIVDFVIGEVTRGAGNVILLHDGGKNRAASVAAVPVLIRELRAQGYEFTSLGDLLGVDRAALMPQASGGWIVFDRLSFEFLSVTWLSIKTVFWVVLAIGLARMLSIFFLALFRRRMPHVSPSYQPKVSVVIPAYNEELTIERCIRSVLASDYPNFDVVVIDDGSQDATFDRALQFSGNPRVKLFAQLNFGKWRALNAALSQTDAEIIVCIDADTQIHPEAIRHLTRRFADWRIGAVAGKIKVGNRVNLLARLQALEYITAQNFDRRAFDLLNGILVVPGSIGAWRAEAVREAGRYCKDTMAEDADLTVSINRAGYRVAYEEKAVAYTEVPQSVRQLLTQRLRWSLGMFQTAWKHKGAIREGRAVGLVSIPDMLIYGYLFPLLAPIADVFVLILLYRLISGAWVGEVGAALSDTSGTLILAYLILPLLDLVVATYALVAEGRGNLRLLWLFPFQRFFYRQLLYFSVYRSVFRAMSGALAGWGKMRRSERLKEQRGTV
jgi:cellulose synthase/poly-beta-1,6-N-acetylglucosamine synthase-like glycosyltransferase/peptidoglycan/xylan/chitin deacetylase (PgdA/CDA1 family)